MPADHVQESEADRPRPVDDLVRTRHTLRTATAELTYTAQTGRIVLHREVHTDDVFDGRQPKAEVFVTSYTVEGAGSQRRPVTFAFNGGPGSASVWLHLGLLGPRRVDVGAQLLAAVPIP